MRSCVCECGRLSDTLRVKSAGTGRPIKRALLPVGCQALSPRGAAAALHKAIRSSASLLVAAVAPMRAPPGRATARASPSPAPHPRICEGILAPARIAACRACRHGSIHPAQADRGSSDMAKLIRAPVRIAQAPHRNCGAESSTAPALSAHRRWFRALAQQPARGQPSPSTAELNP